MRKLIFLKCLSCKRVFSESCYCKIQKVKKMKEKQNKGVELDLSKHCGVFSPSSNTYCLRSLKCKSHSVHLKRAVKGRPKPFDLLLSDLKNVNKPLVIDEERMLNLELEIYSFEDITHQRSFSFPSVDIILKPLLTCKRSINI